uniref:THAP domain-containing protein 1 n=1 Tax=Gouania willdenowi TaxID=441366 RepID=A0A8C5HZU9_GOUWI
MPKSCAAIGCGNHSMQGEKVSFFLFPKESEKRSKWAQALRRVNTDGTRWSPKSKWTYLCGQHFITGKCAPIHNYILNYISN